MPLRRTRARGRDALSLATDLLHRIRLADPLAGAWEAADLQWWWRTPRRSDAVEQQFWLDDEGTVAGVVLTEWKHAWGLDPFVVPDAPGGLREEVWRAGVDLADELALDPVETTVRDDDEPMARLARASGFLPTSERSAVTWMDAADRPAVPDLPDGFELVDRLASHDRPHPLIARNGPDVERRLNEVPLYDRELDLAIRAPGGEVAGYGMFWADPVTRVGLVEPIRTEDAFQRRGLARALVAAGVERLARKGATRMTVAYMTEAARNLYTGLGFRIGAEMAAYARGRSPQESSEPSSGV